MRYRWISEHKQAYPITTTCRVLRVSTSGYCAARDRGPSKQPQRRERVHHAVQSVYDEYQGIYDSWKIAEVMSQCVDLESACRNTVLKAMCEMSPKSRVCKSFKPTTTRSDPRKRAVSNLLDQDFAADGPNNKWVTDITYLPMDQGWVYLAVVMDLFGRKVVGWSIGDSLATGLVSDALRQAIESRRPAPGGGHELFTPFGPWVPVHQRCLSKALIHAGHHLLDEPYRLLLRQRDDGAVLLVA